MTEVLDSFFFLFLNVYTFSKWTLLFWVVSSLQVGRHKLHWDQVKQSELWMSSEVLLSAMWDITDDHWLYVGVCEAKCSQSLCVFSGAALSQSKPVCVPDKCCEQTWTLLFKPCLGCQIVWLLVATAALAAPAAGLLACPPAPYTPALPPTQFSCSQTVPSLRPQAWELLGNQNQLLVLSPLSSFWLAVNCRVVFSESSLWTQRPPLWPWHHCAMENLPHFLLFLQFYCCSDQYGTLRRILGGFHDLPRREGGGGLSEI